MLVQKMEELREALNNIIAAEDLDYEVALAISRQLDQCITDYLSSKTDKVKSEEIV